MLSCTTAAPVGAPPGGTTVKVTLPSGTSTSACCALITRHDSGTESPTSYISHPVPRRCSLGGARLVTGGWCLLFARDEVVAGVHVHRVRRLRDRLDLALLGGAELLRVVSVDRLRFVLGQLHRGGVATVRNLVQEQLSHGWPPRIGNNINRWVGQKCT